MLTPLRGAIQSPTGRPPDKRKDTRFKTRFDVLYTSGPVEGAGVLMDLSYSGARIEGASPCLPAGTRVRLQLFIQPVSSCELIRHVVRSTESGFAIAYETTTRSHETWSTTSLPPSQTDWA